MRKPLVIGGALIGLFAVVLFLLFHSLSGAPDAVSVERAKAPDTPAPEAPKVAEEVAPARETIAAAEKPAALEAPPVYAKFLGGVKGRLVEQDGTPVPGTRIDALTINIEELFPQLDSMFSDEPIDFQEVKGTTKTKDDGTFLFEKLEPRSIYVLGVDPVGPRSTVRMVDKAPNAGEVVDLGDVVLDPFVIFTGRVVDKRGTPIADARVRASNLPSIAFQFGVQDLKPGFSVAFQENFRGSEEWRVARVPTWAFRLLEKVPLPQTKTKEDGSFRLEGVPTGLATVLVDHDGFLSLTHGPVSTSNVKEKELGTLKLDDGETMTGIVVDASDQPIAEAEVLAGPIQDLAPVALMVPVGKTDASGHFTAKGLRDVDHAVAARTKTGVEWTLVKGITPGYDEAKIVLGDTFQVEVTALADGGMIARPQLVVQRKNELPLHPLLVPPIPLGGRLRYTDKGTAIVSDLAKGKYSLLVRGPGYAASQVEADLTKGSTSVVAELEKEFTAKVTVVEKGTKTPVWWATVGIFADDSGDGESRRNRDTQAIPLANKRTGEDGIVTVNGLKKGKYKVVVLHPGYAETFSSLEAPGEPVVVELPAGGSLAGRVHEKGQPPNPDRFIGMGLSGRGEGFPRFNVTDKDGNFHITHLAPGEYQLVVMRRFANQGLGELVDGAAKQSYFPERFESVTIEEGKEAVLDIDLLGVDADAPTAKLSGRCIINGRPAGGVPLRYNVNSSAGDAASRNRPRNPRAMMARMKSTITNENGTFDFGDVVAGDGSIEVSQPGEKGGMNFGRIARVKVQTAANDNREISIDLKVGAIHGRVLADRTGQPLALAELRLHVEPQPPKPGESANAVSFGDWNADVRMNEITDKDGRFHFDYVPAGRYEINVDRKDYAAAKVGGIVVPANGDAPDVDVRLMTGVTVRGKIVLPPAAPGEDADNRRFAFISFNGRDGQVGNNGSRVDTEKWTFEAKELMPGKYDVNCWTGNQSLKPLQIDVPSQGLDNVTLTFEAMPPPEPPKAPGSK